MDVLDEEPCFLIKLRTYYLQIPPTFVTNVEDTPPFCNPQTPEKFVNRGPKNLKFKPAEFCHRYSIGLGGIRLVGLNQGNVKGESSKSRAE